ncbi:uncharacterized protein LOC131022185 isoform X2 [Salvia miltiorrhiza]|uniref:uncharacterized protein LOC131022185 isoform X2 n=1 Tax=Salvia miltiorrhiza TaxID=226208 RepID=UPI0025AB65DB|nr:uncharacterized protein LOC131022185 isoform X2 [Salvia miltiorrhiza]
MVAKSKDHDWIPLTPKVKTASNRRKKSTGKADTTRMKGGASKKPKILKKRRQVRKRISSNKLAELTRVVRDIEKHTCTTLNSSWMNAKKERSNTFIRRKDFKSGFAAHIIGVQDHTEDKVVVSCHGNTENHTQSEEDITSKDKDFDMDASTHKMDCDGANTHDQNDCAAIVTNNDVLFSSFSMPPPSSEKVDCHGINNSVILEAQQVVVNETKEMAVAEVKDVA